MTYMKRCTAVIRSYAPQLWLLCLLMVGGLEFLMVTVGDMHNYIAFVLLHKLILVPCLLFWLVTFVQTSGQWKRLPVGLALVMVVWFVIVELQHRANGMDSHTAGLFLSVYLLAFPFSAVTKDENRQWGIKAMILLFLTASMVLLVYAVLLIADCVPAFFKDDLFWDGARLNAVTHPNVSSRVFMIGIAGCLMFSGKMEKKWQKGMLLTAAALIFSALALTNSRGSVLLTCLIVAGTVFFAVFHGGWKRFFMGAAAGLLVLVVLFGSSQEIYEWNQNRLIDKVTVLQQNDMKEDSAAQGGQELSEKDINKVLGTINYQGSLADDMGTFNNRTRIWKGLFEGIQNNPRILLWGTDSSEKVIVTMTVDHTHNAWLETLVRLGIPGFVLSLVFTAQAIWSAICLMWYPHVGLEKKIISMLMIGFLLSGVLEPFLFFTEDSWHFVDFMFFLCLGYMIQWRKQIHVQEPRREGSTV